MDWQNVIPSWANPEAASDSELTQHIRHWRNAKLAESDWTQLLDSPVATRATWAAYRQKLRDLPQQGANPKLWIIPVPPT